MTQVQPIKQPLKSQRPFGKRRLNIEDQSSPSGQSLGQLLWSLEQLDVPLNARSENDDLAILAFSSNYAFHFGLEMTHSSAVLEIP